MNIERAKIAIDKMSSFLPEYILNDLYKDQNATAEILAQDEKRVVFSIVYHDKKDKRILSITVKHHEINVHYNGTMQVFSHRIDESFYNDVLNVLLDVEDSADTKPNKPTPYRGNTNMNTRMIEVNVEFVIASLESRYEDVKKLWGNTASEALWEQALSLVEDAGLGNCSSPSAYVDNYLINGDFQNKIDDMEYWIENTSQFDEINDLQKSIDELDETDDQKGYQQSQLGTLIDDAWNEYCQDNALIYNDEYACLQF